MLAAVSADIVFLSLRGGEDREHHVACTWSP